MHAPALQFCDILRSYSAGLGSFTGTSIVENELCGVMCDTQGCVTLTGCNIDRNKQSALAVADDGGADASKCSMSENSEVSVYVGAGSNPTLKQVLRARACVCACACV